jgi:general stress protein 26
MDSINQNQPEENFKALQGAEASKKIKDLAESKSCFFCTKVTGTSPIATRPMSVQKVDEQGNLWFLSADDSHKNLEINSDPQVQLLFQGPTPIS